MNDTPNASGQDQQHTGGCACGAVRYRTQGKPKTTAVCHCRYCQTRTGSAFGVSVFFPSDAVEVTQGALTTYAFETASGRSFVTQFCPICGTSLIWNIGLFPDWTAVAGGSFDPPSFWYDLKREVFTRSKAPFVDLCLQHSDATSASFQPVKQDSAALEGS